MRGGHDGRHGHGDHAAARRFSWRRQGFPSSGCLAFAPSRDGDAAILGNVQQRCDSTDPPLGSCPAPANRFIYPSGSCSDRTSVLTGLKHAPRLAMPVAADALPAAADALLAGAGDQRLEKIYNTLIWLYLMDGHRRSARIYRSKWGA
jgi:hypothetical protein